jgi:hypothetical protein
MKCMTLDELLATLPRRLITQTVVLQGVEHVIPASYEAPNFQYAAFDGTPRAAYVGDFEVIIDESLRNPRMNLSPDFVRLQSPELVAKTRKWTNDFFGFDFPIWQINNQLFLHSSQVSKLHDALGGSPYF